MSGHSEISIVDDDASVREAILDLMLAHGYAVAAFESGMSFLDTERHGRTDCLIVDLHMPGMTGLDLYRSLAASGNAIPTILITARPDETMRASALRAGILCCLTKPLQESDLLHCVRSALNRAQEERHKS